MSEFIPQVVDRVTEVAQRLGRFLFTTPEVHPYMSEHFRGAEGMLASMTPVVTANGIAPPLEQQKSTEVGTDGEAMTKQDTAAYYTAMAREAAE